MMKLTLVFLGIIMLGLVGCSDSNVDLVKDGRFSGYPNTTIGKVLDANFDSGKWTTETSNVGTKYVIFTGKINRRLHEIGLSAQKTDILYMMSGSFGVADGRNALHKYFPSELRHYIWKFPETITAGDNDPDWQEILTKITGDFDKEWNASSEERKTMSYEASLRLDNQLKVKYSSYFEEEIMKLFDKYVWPVGGKFYFKWAISADGKNFEIKEFGGTGIIPGRQLSIILKYLYSE